MTDYAGMTNDQLRAEVKKRYWDAVHDGTFAALEYLARHLKGDYYLHDNVCRVPFDGGDVDVSYDAFHKGVYASVRLDGDNVPRRFPVADSRENANPRFIIPGTWLETCRRLLPVAKRHAELNSNAARHAERGDLIKLLKEPTI